MIDNFPQATMAIFDLYSTTREGLRIELRNKFDEVLQIGSPPEKVCRLVELVYANQGDFSTEALAVVADLCTFATGHGFFGLAENGRGFGMASVMNGETVEDAPEAQPASVVAIVPDTPEA